MQFYLGLALAFLHLLQQTCSQQAEQSECLINFLALGDWGKGGYGGSSSGSRRRLVGQEEGSDQHLLGGGGSQTYNQGKVASAMATVASKNDIAFIAGLGDNFYSNGVSSSSDSMWTTFYRTVYYSYFSSLVGIPFYAVLGNHDYGYGEKGVMAQIQRTFDYPDQEWTMPSTNYSVRHTTTCQEGQAQVSVQVIFIDSTTLSPSTNQCCNSKGGISSATQAARINNQLGNIERMLDSAMQDPPTWLLVMGHYPVYSAGEHGDNSEMISYLKPLLEKYKVHAYFCGHDHVLEHLQSNGVEYFVSGAGSMNDKMGSSSAASYKWGAAYTSGFNLVTATNDELQVSFIGTSANTLYTTTLTNPFLPIEKPPTPFPSFSPSEVPSPRPTLVPSSYPSSYPSSSPTSSPSSPLLVSLTQFSSTAIYLASTLGASLSVLLVVYLRKIYKRKRAYTSLMSDHNDNNNNKSNQTHSKSSNSIKTVLPLLSSSSPTSPSSPSSPFSRTPWLLKKMKKILWPSASSVARKKRHEEKKLALTSSTKPASHSSPTMQDEMESALTHSSSAASTSISSNLLVGARSNPLLQSSFFPFAASSSSSSSSSSPSSSSSSSVAAPFEQVGQGQGQRDEELSLTLTVDELATEEVHLNQRLRSHSHSSPMSSIDTGSGHRRNKTMCV